jgi:hypothetical protein
LPRRSRRRVILVGVEAVELLEGGDDVADVEKAVALETEVNERRLHAGQHFGNPALVHVAHDSARALGSMNISATRSSSRIATRVSWALEEMIISCSCPSGRVVTRALRTAPAHQQYVNGTASRTVITPLIKRRSLRWE